MTREELLAELWALYQAQLEVVDAARANLTEQEALAASMLLDYTNEYNTIINESIELFVPQSNAERPARYFVYCPVCGTQVVVPQTLRVADQMVSYVVCPASSTKIHIATDMYIADHPVA